MAADGTPLRAFADGAGMWRMPLGPEEISPLYLEALLTYEDRWFHWHPGVNPLALARAVGQAVRYRRIVSGGSTLTMQVARILEPQGPGLRGKLRQMARALQLERRLDKDQILALYLERAPFGGPLEGVEAAARSYLGKSARSLSHAEAALLAGLPRAPSRLRPDRHPERARLARDGVLARLERFGVWPASTVSEARHEAVAVFAQARPLHAPLLARRLGPASGEVVRTTIDADLQIHLEGRLRALAAGLPERTSAAVLVVEHADLSVRAYLGSADFLDARRHGHVDMVRAVRSPGSTLKPFVYGLALEEGLIHSGSLLVDAPPSVGDYRPANFDGGFEGPVSAAHALQRSLNVPAVDLAERLGSTWLAARLRHGGLVLHLPREARPNPAVVLGGAGVRLEELVGGYAALARGGLAGRPRLRPGDPIEERRLLSAGAAWVVREILEAAPRPRGPEYVSRRPVAWKTGTSYGFRDAWALGVTDRHVVGVWIGRPDATPLPGHHGALSALPLLLRVVDALPAGDARPAGRSPPAGVRRAVICWPLGVEPTPATEGHCQRHLEAWVVDDTVPPTLPSRGAAPGTEGLQAYRVAADSGLRVAPGCAVGGVERREQARWPGAVVPYLPTGLAAAARLPPFDPRCVAPGRPGGRLAILGLEGGSEVRPAPGGDRLPELRLRARGGEGQLYWLIDGALASRTDPQGEFRYRPSRAGVLRLTVVDEAGAFDAVALRVVR